MDILKLKKPVDINGETVTKINYDIDKLTAQDFETAIKQLSKRKIVVKVQELDPMFHAALFAQAADMDLNDIMLLGAKDFANVGLLVRNFIYMDQGEEEDSEDGPQ